ncbi:MULTISPECIES: amidohydrolase family protein [Pseudomonas]|uniref:amidohydrolase family protein n=1 Tax=Pseudomonas TaxID=286 RepID=UPI00137AA2C3|nr:MULTISPECIES: amidohydrolase family protein [Pseudomonas]WBM30510.1 amidohydrolase family protein [Pseudomonas sp. NY11382]
MDTIEPRMPAHTARSVPAGACDVHCHVFGPLDTFATGPATYAIPLAAPSVYRQMLDSVGLDRGVLVQPAPYGTDTRALVNALGELAGRARGVAVADASISDASLDTLHQAGVRGLRFIEMLDPSSGKRYAGSIGVDTLCQLAPRMRERGWHAHIWAKAQDCPRVFETVRHLDMPIVFDHMGQFDVAAGVEGAAFQQFLALLDSGQVWAKLSLCRVSRQAPAYAELQPFHQALVNKRPDRLLWGSDWPFVRMAEQSPDVGQLLDVFMNWVGDEAIIRQILVDNPAHLFGFDSKESA